MNVQKGPSKIKAIRVSRTAASEDAVRHIRGKREEARCHEAGAQIWAFLVDDSERQIEFTHIYWPSCNGCFWNDIQGCNQDIIKILS